MARIRKPPPPAHKQLVYGRRQTRPLTGLRQSLMETLLPTLQIPFEKMRGDGSIDPQKVFSVPYNKVWFEVGFGDGDHLKSLMVENPQNAFIGAEPFINGIATFLASITDMPYDRLRLHNEDAMMLIRSLKTASLDRVYVLNPDPWPKARHHKRRIITPKNLDDFARVLAPGGQLIMTTDHPELAQWMAIHAANHSCFEWMAKTHADWLNPPEGWHPTKYEKKGQKAGRQQIYLLFHRKQS